MFSMQYEGESHFLVTALANVLVDETIAGPWFVEITHWVGDDNGGEASVHGRIVQVDDYSANPSESITIQPTDPEGISDIGDPIKLDPDNITKIVIP